MFGGLASVVGMVQRITRSAERIPLPSRREWRVPTRPSRGPRLVRGLGQRRARGLFPSGSAVWVVAALAAASVIAAYVLFGR